MAKSLNIVFFGIDAFSNIVLNSLVVSTHNVRKVITYPYDDNAFDLLKSTCEVNRIPIIQTNKINSVDVISAVSECKPDICVIAHFERIIKPELLRIPRLGFINLHPSLLPYYRGLAPQHYPIINGEKEVGITVHYVDEGTDTGDIVLQKRYPLSGNTYVAELHSLWMKEYNTIVVEALDLIETKAPTIKQSNEEGSFYPKMESKPYPLDKNWSVQKAYNWVRAMSLPYDGVTYDDMVVYKAHILQKGEIPDEDEPILQFSDGALVAEWYE